MGISLAEELLNNGAARSLLKSITETPRHEYPGHRPSPAGEELVSRLRTLGQVAGIFR